MASPKAATGRSSGEGELRVGEGHEAEWGTRWRRPQQVASVDEVGHGSDDGAEGGWVLERFRAA
jgi:hypothetical protein